MRYYLNALSAMSTNSKIEWTDATWNPVRGCKKVSPGCKRCYAEAFAERFRGVSGHPYQQGFDLRLVPEKLDEPLRWAESRTVFVNSMSDLFQEGVPDDYIEAVCNVMRLATWHTFQVLTKRPEEMKRLLSGKLRWASNLPHVWWGVSVEDKRYGVPRIDVLRRTPAAVRFLSVEPLLEPLGPLDLSDIHWVIVGGESGPGARDLEEDWVLTIQKQCKADRIPFFFKQWGGFPKSRLGRLLLGKTFDDMPTRQAVSPPLHTERREMIAAFTPIIDSWMKSKSPLLISRYSEARSRGKETRA
jgi:protein gp37